VPSGSPSPVFEDNDFYMPGGATVGTLSEPGTVLKHRADVR